MQYQLFPPGHDDEVLAALDEFGGVIIEDFLPAEVVDAFNRELTELIEAERDCDIRNQTGQVSLA